MKKFLLGLVSACFVACGAYADANNKLISFSSPGLDRYADGRIVLDGEWYALVWSADGNFEGFTPDCAPVDENDRVVIVAPLAEGGKCPYTVFQIDSQSANYMSTGTYAVYLLDTRTADRRHVAAKNADGKPDSVNGVAVANSAATSETAATGSVASDGWEQSVLEEADENQPVITAFQVLGAKVQISVDNLFPEVKYNVKMGENPSELDTYGLELPAEDSSSAEFILNPGDAKFFQVVRQPLVYPEAD